ncbi:MAG: MarR family transcriptional regulator [Pseudomonadota bacterium]
MNDLKEDRLALATHLDRLVRRLHADLHPKAVHVDDANVGPLGGMVLMTIEENAPISVQDLAERVARDKGQMTRILQSLERKALVERQAWPQDGRVSLLTLTNEGARLVSAFRRALAEVVDAMFVDVEPQEQVQFLAVLRKLLDAPPA